MASKPRSTAPTGPKQRPTTSTQRPTTSTQRPTTSTQPSPGRKLPDLKDLRPVPEEKTAGVVRACVKAHNEKRALHGCPPLGYSDVLSVSAKKWAESLIQRGAFEHSPSNQYGENIYMRGGNQPLTDEAAAVNAVDQWYAEIKDYKLFNKEPKMQELMSGSPTGHFTQLIWKSTQVMGLGIAKNTQDNNKTIVVCNYAPAGNVVGVFTANVPPIVAGAGPA